MDEFFLFLLVLFVAAMVMRSSLFVNLLYLFSGLYLVGRLWNHMALRSISFTRTMAQRAFTGEEVAVRLEITNNSFLPVVWLRLEEALPVGLAKASFKRIITLPSFGKAAFDYKLHAYKRGYYKIGPLRVAGGDLFGLSAAQTHSGGSQILVIYPPVYDLPGLSLPSRSPMGSLRTNQLIFEDPTRVRSKRDYVSGDSLRRIDWKSSASSGRLQVKQFEPSIALETMIFLNLNAEEYDLRTRFDSTELAIVVSASIASWVNAKRQAIGIATNGLDPFAALETVMREQVQDGISARLAQSADSTEPNATFEHEEVESPLLLPFSPLTPRKGQLMRILDILARVQPASADMLVQKTKGGKRQTAARQDISPQSFIDLLQTEQGNLPWGTTLVLVTGSVTEELFDTVFKLRRRGLIVVMVLVGQISHLQETRQRARHFHIPLIYFRNELELTHQTGRTGVVLRQGQPSGLQSYQ